VKRARTTLVIGATIFLAAAVAFAVWLAWDWHAPFKGKPGPILVSVPKGTHAGVVLESLYRQGVVRSRISAKLAYAFLGRPRSLKAGTYRFDQPLTPLQVIAKLNRGDVVYTKVTIPEGLRSEEIAHILAEAGLGKEEAFLRLVREGRLIKDLDPEAHTLEGYLFPETYLLDPGLSEEAVLQALTKSFRAWWQGHGGPGTTSLSVREVVTLGSLVEKETAAPQERGLIAGVFFNRLKMGMPLQTDPTIVYAEVEARDYKGHLTRDDWSFSSPYNTYLHAGLPPGPICSPGPASMEAVLRPTRTDYLYFVSRNDGTHAFSHTLEEHNGAVERFQKSSGRNHPKDHRS